MKHKARNWTSTQKGDGSKKSINKFFLAPILLFNLALALKTCLNSFRKYLIFSIALFFLIIPSVLAVSVSHPASAIYNGTFSGGNYYFPGNLTANTSTFHVDASTSRVGIGTGADKTNNAKIKNSE